jgi:hypothetical protein
MRVARPARRRCSVFPFGHGLSYDPAVWEEVAVLTPELWPTDGECELVVTLLNCRDRVGPLTRRA